MYPEKQLLYNFNECSQESIPDSTNVTLCLCFYGNSIRTLKRAFLQNIYGVIQKVCGTGRRISFGGKGDTI